VAIIIYFFPVNLFADLIGPTKSSPHFKNGSSGRLVVLEDFELPILPFFDMHHKI
jgi:hypothetical protein